MNLKFLYSILLSFVFFIWSVPVFAQSAYATLDRMTDYNVQAALSPSDSSFHSGIRPYLHRNIDSVLAQNFSAIKPNLFERIAQKPPFLFGKNALSISPLMVSDFNYLARKTEFGAAYGIRAQSQIGSRLNIDLSVYGVQSNLERYSASNPTVPIQNMPRSGIYSSASDSGSIKYADFTGSISFNASKYLQFELGKNKHFWGEGYQSFWLSDYGAAYPYLKAQVTAGRLQYLILYQFLKDNVSDMTESGHENKYAVSHMLSWNWGKRINISFFETVVWRDIMPDSTRRGFDINYLNPIVFFRPVEYSIGSPDNVLMGFASKLRVFRNTHLYGQAIIDEFKLAEIKSGSGWWANKYGGQMGLKTFNLFSIKGLMLLAEFNFARPFLYSHKYGMQAYGQQGVPMAHPLGANFKELVFQAQYLHKRWLFDFTAIKYQIGLDTDSTNYGQNIFRSYDDNRNDYGNFIGQGLATDRLQLSFTASYRWNWLWQSDITAGVRYFSSANNQKTENATYWHLGIRTAF